MTPDLPIGTVDSGVLMGQSESLALRSVLAAKRVGAESRREWFQLRLILALPFVVGPLWLLVSFVEASRCTSNGSGTWQTAPDCAPLRDGTRLLIWGLLISIALGVALIALRVRSAWIVMLSGIAVATIAAAVVAFR